MQETARAPRSFPHPKWLVVSEYSQADSKFPNPQPHRKLASPGYPQPSGRLVQALGACEEGGGATAGGTGWLAGKAGWRAAGRGCLLPACRGWELCFSGSLSLFLPLLTLPRMGREGGSLCQLARPAEPGPVPGPRPPPPAASGGHIQS